MLLQWWFGVSVIICNIKKIYCMVHIHLLTTLSYLNIVMGNKNIGFKWSHTLLNKCGQYHLVIPIPYQHNIYPEKSVFRYPIDYEIRGRFHRLYEDSRDSVTTFFLYPNQRCLTLFMREALGHISKLLQEPPHTCSIKGITFFSCCPIC